MSTRTTNLGARVSQSTVLADGDLSIGTFEIPSWSSLTVDGSVFAQGILSYVNGTLLSNSTTTTGVASTTIDDNEVTITNVDGLTASLRFRSGNTVYAWASDSTATVA